MGFNINTNGREESRLGECIDIDTMDGIHRVETQIRTARKIRAENLEYVNAHDVQVHPKTTFYTRYGKRALDIIISAAALIITLPINIILGICTWVDVGWPIFFRQERSGKYGKSFTIVKFRNMNNKRDENGDLLLAEKRVTKFGKFMRKTSMDELLNFWNVFKGEMSIIGPRPLPKEYMNRFSERHKARLMVRPGLECPIINDLGHVPSWGEKFDNDVFYVENVSLSLDIKMFFLLIRMVFDPESNTIRENGTAGSFMGYERTGDTINSTAVPIKYVEIVE